MSRTSIVSVVRLDGESRRTDQDLVAVESPATLLVTQRGRPAPRSLGLVMRTPGDDRDLALGLLYSEGLIRHVDDVLSVDVTTRTNDAGDREDLIVVTVSSDVDLAALEAERAQMPTSACGVCGRLKLRAEDIHRTGAEAIEIDPAVVTALHAQLRAGQPAFAETGGLHAAGLFDLAGAPLLIREDVGRHNAVDKVVGAALAAGWLPAHRQLLGVSGRVAFEIVHKAAMAGVAAIVAVGAPSSLAVEAARAAQVTLIAFARDGRFNVYAGHARLAPGVE